MLITGLQLGANEVTAAVAGQPRTARLTLVNHPEAEQMILLAALNLVECIALTAPKGARRKQ